jgi:type II secretory ATPase GspE/PulE/Tfp pilus assembly ATPase PilB-like protein
MLTLSPAPLTLASGFMLVSVWKPVLLLLTFVGWAWVITKVYDKHAARFFLPRRTWNIIHLSAGMVALAAALLMPIPGEAAFWVGWLLMIIILAADLAAYAVVANKDERVPERFRIRLSLDALRSDKAAKEAAKLQAKVALTLRALDEKGKYTQTVPVPQPETPEYELRAAAEQVYLKAMASRASQVDIGPISGKEGVYGVSMLVDGVRQGGETMPAPAAVKVMDFWKAAARLDVADRRRRLQGTVQAEHDGVKHIVQVTSIGVQGGMRVTLLFDPEMAVLRKPTELGLLDMQLEELKKLASDLRGIVLLGAPADGGRTTLTYSVAQLHDAYTSNVQTVEAEPQAMLEGVRVNKFEPEKEGAEYSTLLRSVLRRDPQVVFVAEVPDANTAKEALRGDMERTRVYISMRGDNAMGLIEAWVKIVGDPAAAAKHLRGVVAGKLLRKLCQNCRVGYPPSPDMLKKLGLPADKIPQLFKKGGQVLIKNKPEVCPMCQGIGYLGQEGIFEVYSLDDEDRALIAAGNFAGLRAALRKKALPTLQQAAIRKAVAGTTSVEEVMRVTAPPGAAAPGAPAGAAPAAGAPKPAAAPAKS